MQIAGFTLSRYLAREFLVAILAVFALCIGLVFLADMVELLRRATRSPDVSFATVATMAALHTPMIAQKAFPFAVLLGAMAAFIRLGRNNELVVARAAGVSVWQFLAPPVAVAVVAGFAIPTVYSPVAAAFTQRYQVLEGRYLTGRTNLLTVSAGGLWLRQTSEGRVSIVHALRSQDGGRVLEDVTVFQYDVMDDFDRRLDAVTATLIPGAWQLDGVTESKPGAAPNQLERLNVPTTLTLDQIQESFAPPETMSFWELPAFIRVLESSGFPAARHRLHWHALISQPMLLAAMVLVAAAFSLRLQRLGGITKLLGGGVAAGFGLYFVSDVALALGLSGAIPPAMAAWTPAAIAAMLGAAALFHIEDG
ncbi:LPS export ABC transporter permease LptG [Futiania mangrovi]|uniref:LPS export ABC transporter permease LptG n=1 Tax=Futiania mangrovi TaxID=2959716 RepID=A0A9J6P830_9PROT|nr:LPS export ABC transporter permease LptG [Futiania mangrovii]MCP1335652.1 LPS export ABC transporter permease LptG [Futiania mangrovii]